jgi:hypothetical protein
MLKGLKEWWFRLFYEEYHLSVWFEKDIKVVGTGDKRIETSTKVRKEFKLKAISKRSPTHIKGKDLKGRAFELKTVKPFDYQIRKIY